MGEGPTISTHVLDTETGRPAADVDVTLFRRTETGEQLVGRSTTDSDGRIRHLLEGALDEGWYRIEFWIAGPFFHLVQITFFVDDTTRSYHVPLLLSPYSLTTYRGS